MSWLESRIPPAAVAMAAALAMWLAARALPAWRVHVPAGSAIAIALALLAIAIGLAGIIEFRRARTTVNPMRPGAATALVGTGVFRVTRNPMYLGIALALLAWAVHLSHPLALAGTAFFVAYMNRFQIIPEERALRSLFGAEFDAYASRVRRWI